MSRTQQASGGFNLLPPEVIGRMARITSITKNNQLTRANITNYVEFPSGDLVIGGWLRQLYLSPNQIICALVQIDEKLEALHANFSFEPCGPVQVFEYRADHQAFSGLAKSYVPDPAGPFTAGHLAYPHLGKQIITQAGKTIIPSSISHLDIHVSLISDNGDTERILAYQPCKIGEAA